ncbi:MAG TPA: hypothetical protein EYN91_23000 [Candidatus Melainabacteria bacterium]|jgi:hypothetical protein|nr:hypothetical protein [Candidatus Melainabacteria bacterium]HIN64165.1 hypothetical protein [Candidatus Obscuribacterales bacterium]
MQRGILTSLAVGAIISASISAPQSAFAKCEKFPGVTDHITVQAEPRIVYECIRELRYKPGSNVKELRATDHEATLEEHFTDLPIVKTAKCTYVEKYTCDKEVAYKMVSSDKFKAFEGKWELNQLPGEKATDVSLQSFVLLDLPVPFLRQLTNTQTIKGVKERLAEVKKLAEAKATASAGTTK